MSAFPISVVKAIGDQAAMDLGFKVTMQNLDTPCRDQPLHKPCSIRSISPISRAGRPSSPPSAASSRASRSVKKIGDFDNILPIFTKGEIDGHKIPRQGISPYEAHVYREARFNRFELTASPNGQPSCRRSTTPTPSAVTALISSAMNDRGGSGSDRS